MGYGIFITAHGGRGQGTSQGTYVVPPGVHIQCYTDDAVLLKGSIGMKIEDRLMMPSLNIASVRKHVSKTYKPFDIMPNYTAFGAPDTDGAFQMETGAYFIGQKKGKSPILPIGEGEKMKLGDIIGKFRKAKEGLVEVYWLCCRAAPQNANNTSDVSVDAFGIEEQPMDMGLSPSKVAKTGSWR